VPYRPIGIKELQDRASDIFQAFGLEKVAVFGSCARNEMRRGSDIDLLVQLPDLNNPLVFVELKRKLENRLKRKIELISYGSLETAQDTAAIMADLKVIYEKH